MKLVRYSLFWAAIILLALTYACSDSDSDPQPQPTVERIPLTQAELDSAWTYILSLNAPFQIGGGNPPIFGHQADSAIRDVYWSKRFDNTKDLEPGSIFVKRLFEEKVDSATKDTVKGNLKEVFVIHKQRKGYFPAGGDFDYYYIPVTGNGTDLKKNRNGVLTNSFKDYTGKVAFCGDCHAKAPGNDWSFSFSRAN